MEMYIEKVINCGYFAHKKWAKGEKVYVTNPSNQHNTFWTCPFIKPQTLNLKFYHLLHNKERFKCIKANVGMKGDQWHLVGTNSELAYFIKPQNPKPYQALTHNKKKLYIHKRIGGEHEEQ